MSQALTGLEADIRIAAASSDTPTTLTGTAFPAVADVSASMQKALADVTTRANAGWRSQRGTLKELSITLTHIYKGTNTQLDILRAAFIGNTQVDVSMITAAAASAPYEGLVGRFEVTGFDLNQPLEEGQAFEITLTLAEFGAWISGTHSA